MCVDPRRAGTAVYSTKNISCMLRSPMRALHHAMMSSHATIHTTIIHADCALKELKALMMYSRNWACSRQYHTTPARCSPRHGEFATHAIVTRCRPSCIGFFVVDQARLGGAVRPCRDEFGVWSVIRAPIPWPRGKQLAESSSMQMPCWPVRAFVSSRRGRRRPGYETERRAGWAGHRKK